MEETNVKIDECQELKNIKYKTMLLNGTPLQETKSSNDLSNLEKFLEEEQKYNSNEPWCKLNKTIKTKKLIEFVELYSKEHNLNEEDVKIMITFFKDSLDKKRLSRVKDVVYDKINGIIKEIPALTYNKSTRHFTLKNIDKRISTLKSLTPKKGNGTIRNKVIQNINNDIDSETDEDKD